MGTARPATNVANGRDGIEPVPAPAADGATHSPVIVNSLAKPVELVRNESIGLERNRLRMPAIDTQQIYHMPPIGCVADDSPRAAGHWHFGGS